MPTDEHGDKWACEPCIRGHRSTKCEHWDRFMLRVKKPGRPLSSCPHPKNQCNCGKERVMMVRIPKASSCICAPAYSLGPDGLPLPTEVNQQSYGSFLPPTISYQAPIPQVQDPYRVQKPSRRTLSVVDPQSVARAFEANKQFLSSTHSTSNLPSFPLEEPKTEVYRNSFGETRIDIQGKRSKDEDEASSGGKFVNGFHNTAYQVSIHASPRTHPLISRPIREQQTPTNESPQATCCQQKTVSPVEHTAVGGQAQASVDEFNPKKAPRYSPTRPLWQHDVPQTTVYTIPSSYATASHPLHPEQLAQFQYDTQRFSQRVPYYAPSGILGSAAPSADGSKFFNPAHNCNCGPGCTCKFCAVHPYNATTRHFVQDLGQILEDGYEYSSQSVSANQSPSSTIDAHHNPPAGDVPPPPAADGSRVQDNLDESSPQPVLYDSAGYYTVEYHLDENLPRNTPSPPTSVDFELNGQQGANDSERQTYSASQETYPVYTSSGYYPIEYPLNGDTSSFGYTNTRGNCLCSTDCTCASCVTHSGHEGNLLLDHSSPEALEHPFSNTVTGHEALGATSAPVESKSLSKCCE